MRRRMVPRYDPAVHFARADRENIENYDDDLIVVSAGPSARKRGSSSFVVDDGLDDNEDRVLVDSNNKRRKGAKGVFRGPPPNSNLSDLVVYKQARDCMSDVQHLTPHFQRGYLTFDISGNRMSKLVFAHVEDCDLVQKCISVSPVFVGVGLVEAQTWGFV
ncbi:hypothetical protein NX059_010488 [Plenodomus lindquistii]|nr:hypothetical protein NX059_010488 [Plenodomus lindquistii]